MSAHYTDLYISRLKTESSNLGDLAFFFFTLSNANHGESIVMGLAASSTSKGSQVKTTKPMVSIKVPNCRFN